MVYKKLTLVLAALAVCGFAALPGCGDDDDGATAKDGGGGDVINNEGGDGGPDGGPCKFNDFVTGLINNSTTATALPSTDLGDKCTDEQKLFPQSIF